MTLDVNLLSPIEVCICAVPLLRRTLLATRDLSVALFSCVSIDALLMCGWENFGQRARTLVLSSLQGLQAVVICRRAAALERLDPSGIVE